MQALEPALQGFPALVTAGRAASLRLFVSGDPVPKGRPRTKVVAPKGGKPFAQIYTDGATREWEERVAREVKYQLNLISQIEDGQHLALPFRERVVMFLRFNLEKPKSYPAGVILPVHSRADVDNLAKAVLDALQVPRKEGEGGAGLLANDNIVTDLLTCKRYADADHPVGVEIDLTGLQA